jgi:hypothetical protein
MRVSLTGIPSGAKARDDFAQLDVRAEARTLQAEARTLPAEPLPRLLLASTINVSMR